VEDDYTVEGIVLGYVRGGDGMRPPHAPEDVLRGAFLGLAERVACGAGALCFQVRVPTGVERAGGPQAVEEGPFQRDSVGRPHDALLFDLLYRPECLPDPRSHATGDDEPSRGGVYRKEAVGEDPLLVRQGLYAL